MSPVVSGVRGGSLSRLVALVVLTVVGLGVSAGSASATAGSDWLPVRGTMKVSCTWNNGCWYKGSSYHKHPAIDLAVGANRAVYASGAGAVSAAKMGCWAYTPNWGCHDGMGNHVAVNHGSHVSRYLHFSSIAVGIRAGVKVKAGQFIGRTGNSGASDGAHLHYDERKSAYSGAFLNPGALRVCHGKTRKSYGGSGWNKVRTGTTIRNESYSCATPPSVPKPVPPNDTSTGVQPNWKRSQTTSDFNGDGKSDVLYLRARDGAWLVSWAGSSGFGMLRDGQIDVDRTFVGDFNGDGRSDVLYFRERDGVWLVSWSGTSGFTQLRDGQIDTSRVRSSG
ncbi:MAG: peptidoglycan DD-metalloendopeptidase family protein [Solirubrobacterales bacterium]|nr:peptidoglycan DD-metalloendopeptidase family protein [Solirubrobacterales bacterium]